MFKSIQNLALITLTLTFFGCASERNLIVLMPDNEGKVGEVVVSNTAGSQTLSQAGQGIAVPDAGSKPREPKPIDEQKIANLFGKALAAQPLPPTRFLLYFKSDSTQLAAESRSLIPEIVQSIKERDAVDISIVGHTDTLGDKGYNLSLSTERARTVARLLAAEGIDAGLFEITSHGEGNPLIRTADNVSEPKNRRVEVTVR